MSAITAKASRKMKKYAVLTREPRCFLGSFDFSWEQRKLGELVDRVVRKNTNNESTLPLTISAQYGLVDQITYFNNRVASRDVSNYYLVLNGEFAYNKSTSDGYPFGAVKRLDLYEKGVLSTLYIVFAPKKEQQIDSDYLTVFFDTDRWHKGVAERAAEGARNHGLLNISAEDFFDIDLSVPKDIVEQKQIGAFIRQLDNLITLHQRKFEKLTNVKKSMLEKMFPQNGSSYPEIRFKGFTDPWEQRKLGEIGSVSMCRRIFKEQTSETGDIPFYKIGTFGADPDAFISRELFEEYKSKYPYPQKGDILISASGSIGRAVEFAGNNEYFQDSNIVWLNHDERLSNPFLKCFYSVVKWAGIEGSTIKRLYNDNILNTVICMPSVPEQKRIGLFFENLDNLITLHQRECISFTARAGRRILTANKKRNTSSWEQRKLGDIADIVGGGTPSTGNQSYWDGDIDWYAPAEIADQIYANSSQKKITGLGYENSSAKMLPPGTVLFTSRAGIGKTAILTRKGCTNQGFQSIVPHRGELDSYFIFSRTEELKRYGELVGAGSTFVEVSGKQMAVMELMMPPTMREQQTIGGFFQQLDHLITLHQRELEKLQNIKKSMLEKMFV